MTNNFHRLIPEPRRKELYQAGESLDTEDVEPGLVVATEHGTIRQISHLETTSERSMRHTNATITRTRVHFNSGGHVGGPERIARLYHDVTELAYREIGAKA